jgi:RNA polymerase sigma factor (sigma-70 family)
MSNGQAGGMVRQLRRLAEAQTSEVEDGRLLERFVVQREEAAFAALVRRHGPMVLQVSRRVLRHHHEAEDIFQAAFLALARRAASIRKGASVACWLHSVAYRLALKARFKARKRQEREVRDTRAADTDPLAQLTARELLTSVDEELQKLPEKFRAPLLYCYFQEKTHRRAAQLIGCPLGTLRSRLERARELLRVRLARRGVSLSAALVAKSLGPRPAALTAALVERTIHAGVQIAAGKVAAGVTANVVTLSKQAGAGSFATPLKLVFALVLAGCGVAIGTGLIAPSSVPGRPRPQPIATGRANPLINPEEQAKVHTDLHGDPLPPGALVRLGTIRFRHPNGVSSLGFTPDARVFVTGCFDGAVRLWDMSSGRERQRLLRPPSWAELLSGRRSGKEIYSLSLSPDGQSAIAAYYDGLLCLWDLSTGKLRRSLQGHGGVVRSVSFSPGGEAVASASDDGTVRLWESATGKEIRRFSDRFQDRLQATPWSVAFAPDGKTLATGGDLGELHLWDVGSGKELHRCRGHDSVVEAVCFSPDGRTFASGGEDKTTRLWDVRTGKALARFPKVSGSVHSLTFSPDGRKLAAVDNSGKIHVWKVSTAEETCRIVLNWRTAGFSLRFSPDGKSLALGDGCTVGLWDSDTGKRLIPPNGHRSAVYAVAFSPDGKMLASGSLDNTIGLWDPATGKQIQRLTGHDEAVQAVSFALRGKYLASAGADKVIRLWELPAGKPAHRLSGYANWKLAIAVSPDGKTLAAQGEDGLAHLWDVASGQELCRLQGLQDLVFDLAFSPDGKLLASAGRLPPSKNRQPGSNIALWDVAKQREVRQIEGHDDLVSSVVFSPDGQALASASEDGTVQIRETATGKERRRFLVPRGGTPAIALSTDGTLLAVAGADARIRLWDIATGKERARFSDHPGAVLCLAFSPDGKKLASGSTDSTILVWDTTPRTFRENPSFIRP